MTTQYKTLGGIKLMGKIELPVEKVPEPKKKPDVAATAASNEEKKNANANVLVEKRFLFSNLARLPLVQNLETAPLGIMIRKRFPLKKYKIN